MGQVGDIVKRQYDIKYPICDTISQEKSGRKMNISKVCTSAFGAATNNYFHCLSVFDQPKDLVYCHIGVNKPEHIHI